MRVHENTNAFFNNYDCLLTELIYKRTVLKVIYNYNVVMLLYYLVDFR